MSIDFGILGIADARALRVHLSMRQIVDNELVISCREITIEAQNALLKAFEELPDELVLTFRHPAPETLLPTFRSRFLDIEIIETEKIDISGADFLSMTIGQRLQYIKNFENAESLLVALEEELHKKGIEQSGRQLRQIVSMKRLLSTAVPKRAILEHIACII